MLTSKQPQKLAKTRSSILALELCQHVPRIHSRHHPESPLAFDFQNIRSPDQMTIAIPTVLIFSVVAKNHTDASASSDGNSTKVSGHRLIEALGLGPYNPREIEICMAFPVQIYINCVQHNCAPFAARMALPGNPHGTTCADIVQDSW